MNRLMSLKFFIVFDKLKFGRNNKTLRLNSDPFSFHACAFIHHSEVRPIWIQRNEQKTCYLCISKLIQMDDAANCDCFWSVKMVRNRRMKCVNVGCMFICGFLLLGKAKVPSQTNTNYRTEWNWFIFLFSCRTVLRNRLYALGGTMWVFVLLIAAPSPFSLLLYIGHWNCFSMRALPTSKGYRWLMSHTRNVIIYLREKLFKWHFEQTQLFNLGRLFMAVQLCSSHRFKASHFNAADWVGERINNSWSDAQYFQSGDEVISLLGFDIYFAIFAISNRRGGRRYRTMPESTWRRCRRIKVKWKSSAWED